jgi:hypothetical protein
VNFSTSSTILGAENVFWTLPNVVGVEKSAEPGWIAERAIVKVLEPSDSTADGSSRPPRNAAVATRSTASCARPAFSSEASSSSLAAISAASFCSGKASWPGASCG